MSERMLTSYTMWRSFRDCRKAAHWRFILSLE